MHSLILTYEVGILGIIGILRITELKWIAADAAKLLQSCPTLYDPVPRILQARTLEWVAISFSSA